MAQSSRQSDIGNGRSGYMWVWLADALGLTIAAGLIAAAAGAPALKHVANWLIMTLPFAGFAFAMIGDRGLSPQAGQHESTARRSIVITPRPNEDRDQARRSI